MTFFVKILLHKKNITSYIPIAIFLILVAYYTRCALGGVDFDVFLHAAAKLKENENIYHPPFIRNLQYFYSPLFATILIPFSAFPYWITECIWLAFSCYCVYRSWVLCTRYFNISSFQPKQYKIWLWFSLFFTLRFILDNFTQVQMSIFLLWATLESLALFKKRKTILGASLLALAINIKIMPILFLPYLFYRKKVKEGFLVVAFYMLYLYLPAMFIGYRYNSFLLHEWWAIINPANPEHIIEATNGPHSLDAMLSVFITNTTGSMQFKRNFMQLSFNEAATVINTVRLFFVLLVLYFLRSLPFTPAHDSLKEFWEISYLFLITPLIFPHMQIYAFIYTAPIIIYLLYFFIVQSQGNIKIKFSLVFYFSIVSILFTPIIGRDVIGSFLFHILQHYRVLTFATILLIPIAIICSPKKLSSSSFKKHSSLLR